jgi:hypothetical protein
MKKIIIIGSTLFFVAVSLLVADYNALFGTSEESKVVLQEVKFRLIDDVTSSPVMGARVRCFQKGRKNDVCFQRDSGKIGIVAIKIPRSKIISKSLFFEQSYRYTTNGSTDLNVMLMHLNYVNEVVRYNADEMFANKEGIHDVTMTKQDWGSDDNG